uniref:Uncharacterized protein n=1 Tax=Arundo donax TaxID=35708 RepID=A0A0A9BYL1_ARUDO
MIAVPLETSLFMIMEGTVETVPLERICSAKTAMLIVSCLQSNLIFCFYACISFFSVPVKAVTGPLICF